jgi:hypothetical protein
MKICSKCKIEKSREEFGKRPDSKDGYKSNCRLCCNAGVKKWETENKDKVKDRQAARYIANSEHIKMQQKEHYNANKEAKQLKAKEWHKNNPEKAKAKGERWRAKNKDKLKELDRAYGQNNPDKICAKAAKRRSAKLNATPKWLTEEDFEKIRQIYKEAKRLEKLDGIKRHVDHIIPLQGKTVSGFHMPENLQILTEAENCIKSNKLDS